MISIFFSGLNPPISLTCSIFDSADSFAQHTANLLRKNEEKWTLRATPATSLTLLPQDWTQACFWMYLLLLGTLRHRGSGLHRVPACSFVNWSCVWFSLVKYSCKHMEFFHSNTSRFQTSIFWTTHDTGSRFWEQGTTTPFRRKPVLCQGANYVMYLGIQKPLLY